MILCRLMNKVPRALAPAVYFPGLLYETIVRTRNRMYAALMLKSCRLPAPLISIGNITMGGTGKTPIVIYVAHLLLELGLTPAILTRGYGRLHSSDLVILAPGEEAPSAAILGDEPALIRRRVPLAWLGISKDRITAGKALLKRHPGLVFLLDDGFQHRRIHRDLDIVILDSSQPLAGNRVFPRGTLREPIAGLRRCHAILVNQSLESARSKGFESQIGKIGAQAKMFGFKQSIHTLSPFAFWKQQQPKSQREFCGAKLQSSPAAVQSGKAAYLVCAVGNPERFKRDIQRIGIEAAGTKFFADHHWISRNEWLDCAENARAAGADVLITTEKDAVKISEPPGFPLLIAEQTTEMDSPGDFRLFLKKKIEERQ